MSTTIVVEAEGVTEVSPAEPARKAGRRVLVLAIVGMIVLGGIGAGAYYMLNRWGQHGGATAASEHALPESYVDVPEMIVNLRDPDGRMRFLKLHFMLVAADPGKVDAIKARLPVYLDALQPFLRELRPEDLNGSAAVYRMKEEMMARANDALGAGTVQDVLIQDLIQQ